MAKSDTFKPVSDIVPRVRVALPLLVINTDVVVVVPTVCFKKV